MEITEQEFKERTFERLWSKVKFGEPDECWEWQASLNTWNYGQIGMPIHGTNPVKYKTHIAHRICYALVFGEFDSKLKCLHKCDNPKCCNPNHLYVGTDKDNMQDMVRRGRHKKVFMRGELHGQSKLTEGHVRLIKMRLGIGESENYLANIFGVSFQHISRIKLGKTWRHVKL